MNILITGCGSGLGKSLFKIGLTRKYNVFPHYRQSLTKSDDVLIGDICSDGFADLVKDFCQRKKIDVFINNAAIRTSGDINKTKDEDIQKCIQTNVTSQILILKRVYNFFRKKSSGLIININSLAGLNSSSQESVYCASKFALRGFSKSLQLESIGSGVEFIGIYSGAMKTKMTQERQNYESLMCPDEIAKQIYDCIPSAKHYINEIILRKRNEGSYSK